MMRRAGSALRTIVWPAIAVMTVGLLVGAGPAGARSGRPAPAAASGPQAAQRCEQRLFRVLAGGRAATADGALRRAIASSCQHLTVRDGAVPRGPEAFAAGDGCQPGCCITIPPGDIPVTAALEGYANVTKLGESALIGPGLLDLVVQSKLAFDTCRNLLLETSTGHLDDGNGHRQFPPARSTFLAFGAVPVTATEVISQASPNITILTEVNQIDPLARFSSTATADLMISITDVKVNGVPLNVGSHCSTERPFRQVLSAAGQENPQPVGYFDPRIGGPLSGFVHIPPFTGCGVGENLDPLFTASISGPRNFSLITQGPTCPGSCTPPPVPVVLRTLPVLPGWTVRNGGNFTADLTPGTIVTVTDASTTLAVQCTASALAGSLPDGTGLFDLGIGEITSATFGNCTGPAGSTGATLTARTPWDISTAEPGPGTALGWIGDDGDGSPTAPVDVTFTFTSPQGPCTAEVTDAPSAPGLPNFTYTNSTGVLAVSTAETLTIATASGAGCTGINVGDPVNLDTGSGGYMVTTSGGHPTITLP